MAIGDMKPIILETWTQGKNAVGSLEDQLQNRYKLWAEVKYDSGNRNYAQGQEKLAASYTFKIWMNNYNPDGLYKIVYDGHTYTIHSIRKVNEKRFNYVIKTDANVS